MSESFQQLDPNYVIAFDFSPDNLTQLLTELCAKGLHVLPRPGYDKDTVYAFTRVDDRDIHRSVDGEGETSIETSEESGDEILHRLCQPLKFVKSITKIHDFETRKKLDKTSSSLIAKPLGLPSTQELVQLERLTRNARQALYFAFFKTYILWLIPLSVVGVFSKIIRPSTSWEFNIPYTAFLVVWSLLFASSWVYKSEPLYSSKFGKVQSFSETSEQNLSTASTVLLKKLCFLPVAILFVASLLSFQFICFFVEIFITQFYAGPLGSIMALIPTVMICSFIPVLTIVYNKVFVDRLVKWENGPNPVRSKVEKNFILTFFTSYVPLLITLLVYLPLGYKITPELRATIAEWSYKLHIPIGQSDFVIDINRYRNQYFYFTVTNQVIAFSMENLVPLFQSKLVGLVMSKIKKGEKDTDSIIASTVKSYFPRELPVWQKVNSYHVNDFGEFNVDDNFRKVIIQFGYLSMFSTIWPLAPLVSLVFSYAMFKADLWRALKKCTPSTNPNDIMINENNYNATPVSSNPWNSILSAISWVGATAGPTLLVMYRYCGLPGVGLETTLSKRDLWFKRSPLPYSWTAILLIAVASEHLAVLSFAYFRKFFIAANQKFARGFVPATELKEPPQIDLSSVVRQTTSFMNEITGKDTTSQNQDKESRNSTAIQNDATAAKPPLNAPETDPTQPTARGVSLNHESKTINNDAVSPVAVTKRNESEQSTPVVSEPKNIHHIAAKTSSIQAPNETFNQEKTKDNKVIGGDGSSASSSTVKEHADSTQSQTKSNQEDLSIAAGATLPATIPTSKNYHLRYDSDGNPITPSDSTGTSEASLSNTRPQGQRIAQEKTEPLAGVMNGVAATGKESKPNDDSQPEKTVATEIRSLDPAKALNTIPQHARDEHLIPTPLNAKPDATLAANAAAAALSSHSRTSSQVNAVQQFGREVPNSVKSTKTTNTSVTDNQKASVNRSNSVKSKSAHSSHTQQSDATGRPLDGNQRRKSVEKKPGAKVSSDHKSKPKKGLLHKLKKKL